MLTCCIKSFLRRSSDLLLSVRWSKMMFVMLIYLCLIIIFNIMTLCLRSGGVSIVHRILLCSLCGCSDVVFSIQVKRTYSHGTYRAGAMRQISLVGAVDEEVGDYFPEFLGMLQQSPFLEVSMLTNKTLLHVMTKCSPYFPYTPSVHFIRNT